MVLFEDGFTMKMFYLFANAIY